MSQNLKSSPQRMKNILSTTPRYLLWCKELEISENCNYSNLFVIDAYYPRILFSLPRNTPFKFIFNDSVFVA